MVVGYGNFRQTDEMLADLQELLADMTGNTMVARPRKKAAAAPRRDAGTLPARSQKPFKQKFIVAAGTAISVALIGLLVCLAWMPSESPSPSEPKGEELASVASLGPKSPVDSRKSQTPPQTSDEPNAAPDPNKKNCLLNRDDDTCISVQ